MNKQEYDNKLYECDNDIANQRVEIISHLIANGIEFIFIIGILTIGGNLVGTLNQNAIIFNIIASSIAVPMLNKLTKDESLLAKLIKLYRYKRTEQQLTNDYTYEQEKQPITDKEIEQVMTITSINTIDDKIEQHQFKRLVKQYKPTNNKNGNR